MLLLSGVGYNIFFKRNKIILKRNHTKINFKQVRFHADTSKKRDFDLQKYSASEGGEQYYSIAAFKYHLLKKQMYFTVFKNKIKPISYINNTGKLLYCLAG